MKYILVCLLALVGSLARANDSEIEFRAIERSRDVIDLMIDLNPQTVRCLIGDYGSSSLKISIPELRAFTVFAQTTRGETAPCINAGSCQFDHTPDGQLLNPSLILDPNRPREAVRITIVLAEEIAINHKERTCDRYLSETVSSPVRGLEFKHVDGTSLGRLDYDLCVAMR